MMATPAVGAGPGPEVVVVGAGPGGSAAAYHLALLGRRVVMVERQAFPRDKSCGDGLTRAAMRELALMGVSADDLGGRPARGVRVSMRGRGERLFDYPPELPSPANGLVVPRMVLDHALCRRAVDVGADLHERTVATRLIFADGSVRGVVIEREGHVEELRAPVVVAADGAASRLARQAGLVRTSEEQMGFAIRAYVEGIAGLEDRLEVVMPLLDATDRYLLPSYGWVFPIGPDSANVGVGLFERAHGSNVRELLQRFLSALREADPRFNEAVVRGRPRGAPMRFDFAPERSFAPGLLLVGDAAGMISPFTGEGISFAVESGRVAAEVVHRRLGDHEGGAPDAAPDLSEYGTRLGEKYTGYFEVGQHAARRYRVVWHVLENSFQSERPMFALARQAVLFPEGVGESFVDAAFHDVRPHLGPLERRARHDLVSVAQVLVDEVRRDWPFLARASAFDRSTDRVPFRPALLLLLCSYAGAPDPMQATLVSAALELGYLGGLAQVSVEDGRRAAGAPPGEAESEAGGPANWGNMFAVMVADFLFGKAYRMSSAVGPWLGRVIADAVGSASEARVREIRRAGHLDVREAELLQILEDKMAALFALPCRVGASLGGLPDEWVVSLEAYGRALGVAFELMDQVREIDGTPRRLGAAARTDLADGLLGLPLLHAAGNPGTGQTLRRLLSRLPLSSGNEETLKALVRTSGARTSTVAVAKRFAEQGRHALRELPEGDVKTALEGLLDFTIAQTSTTPT
jgi:geranylgeranyl reductase family protein